MNGIEGTCTLLRMRPNSLFLNSWRAERLRRSRKSSPLRSTTSSSSCSVVMARISSRSCSLFAIATAAAARRSTGCDAAASPANRIAVTPPKRRDRNAVRGAGAAMPRGVEVRGDAAARDIVAIVVLQRSRFRYRSLGSRIRGCCGGLSGFLSWWAARTNLEA